MNNDEFLTTILNSFVKYLDTNSRSNAKLKILHGDIANDIRSKIDKKYSVYSLSETCKSERNVEGQFNNKKVDICIAEGKKNLVSIAVKFVMQNYSQNSINYFENMLGETVNIREKNIDCFQIIIIPRCVPYFSSKEGINKIETLTDNNLSKYLKLSKIDSSSKKYIPNKLLLIIVDLPMDKELIGKKVKDYKDYMKQLYNQDKLKIKYSNLEIDFGDNLILNNYELFIKTVIKDLK